MKKRIKFIFYFTVLIGLSASAQSKKTIQVEHPDYSQNPEWIKMIDNPNTNYYEAVKAFDTYWKNRIKPEGEDDFINENASRKEERERKRQKKELAKMTPPERNEYNILKYQCKRYENWVHEVKPFVQEDGRILTQQERIEMWNKQQTEIKNQK